jgi:hypothetical protein
MKKTLGVVIALLIIGGGAYWYLNSSNNSQIDRIISQEPAYSTEQDSHTKTFSESGALMITDSNAIALKNSESGQKEAVGLTLTTGAIDAQYAGQFNWIGSKVVFVPHIPCDHNCPEQTGYELTGVNPDRFVVYRGSFTGNAASASPGTTSYLDTKYGKDDTYVYYGNAVIEDADPNTFEIYADAYGGETEYSRDRGHVFRKDMVVEGADPKTFKPNL